MNTGCNGILIPCKHGNVHLEPKAFHAVLKKGDGMTSPKPDGDQQSKSEERMFWLKEGLLVKILKNGNQ